MTINENKTLKMRHVKHPFPAVVSAESEILILGSVPSVKSVEYGFYYMHPQNRFWKILSAVTGENFTEMTVPQRKTALIKHKIALYDSVEECDVGGSSDASIANVIPADIETLISGTKISAVFCNGQSAYKYFVKYHPNLSESAIILPSTSPANAAFGVEQLISIWNEKIKNAVNFII